MSRSCTVRGARAASGVVLLPSTLMTSRPQASPRWIQECAYLGVGVDAFINAREGALADGGDDCHPCSQEHDGKAGLLTVTTAGLVAGTGALLLLRSSCCSEVLSRLLLQCRSGR